MIHSISRNRVQGLDVHNCTTAGVLVTYSTAYSKGQATCTITMLAKHSLVTAECCNASPQAAKFAATPAALSALNHRTQQQGATVPGTERNSAGL
jgi:hypothetical protein